MKKMNKRILVTCVCLFLVIVMVCSCGQLFDDRQNENEYTDAPATAGKEFVTGAKPETKPEPGTEAPPEPTVADEYIAILADVDHLENGVSYKYTSESEVKNLTELTFKSVTVKQYPIGGWGTPAACLRDERSGIDGSFDEAYRLLADAGFTFVISQDEWSDPAWTLEALSSARKANLGFWYNGGNQTSAHIINRVNSMLSSADAGALKAVIVSMLPGEGELEDIGEISKDVRRELGADSALKVFSILPPPYAANAGYTSHYRNFLSLFSDRCKPHIIMTDYALYQGESGNTAEDMLTMLVMERNLFSGGSHPLYATVQCARSGDTLRAPTLYELRFNVHAAIACGAHGIVYKTACEQEYGNAAGLLDKNGQITEAYKQVMAVNHEVNAMKGSITSYNFSTCLFINNDDIVEKFKVYGMLMGGQIWGSASDIKVKDDKFLIVGCFRSSNNDIGEGFYCVNPDLTDNTTMTIDLTTRKLFRVWSGKGGEVCFPGDTLTITLGPGEGVFIELYPIL